jgi:F-type H+-transporting ATPase subunit b
MGALVDTAGPFLLAAEGGDDGGGSFLVSPSLGLMIWTLLAFGATLLILNKLAFPRIAEALDRRRKAIDSTIDAAERTRREADVLLREYRARLIAAREQADDIVARARRAADVLDEQARQQAHRERDLMLQVSQLEIQAETRRALDELREDVANMTVTATERVTRKSLTPDDHRRLIEEALHEVDFSGLAGDGRADGGHH